MICEFFPSDPLKPTALWKNVDELAREYAITQSKVRSTIFLGRVRKHIVQLETLYDSEEFARTFARRKEQSDAFWAGVRNSQKAEPFKFGIPPRMFKLGTSISKKVRVLYWAGHSMRTLAEYFDLTLQDISKIVHNKGWD